MTECNDCGKNHDEEMMPELKDIMNRIHAYNAVHKNGCFVYNFMGIKKIKGSKCECCDDELDDVDLTKSTLGAYGDIEDVRNLLNMLRDIVEDEKDEEEFVNV